MQLFGLAIWTGRSKRWILLDGLTFGKKSAQIVAPLSMQTKAMFVYVCAVSARLDRILTFGVNCQDSSMTRLGTSKIRGTDAFPSDHYGLFAAVVLRKPAHCTAHLDGMWMWRARMYKALWLCWGHSCHSIAWRQHLMGLLNLKANKESQSIGERISWNTSHAERFKHLNWLSFGVGNGHQGFTLDNWPTRVSTATINLCRKNACCACS